MLNISVRTDCILLLGNFPLPFHVDIYGEYDILLLWHRHLKGEDLNSLQPKELIMIEEALDNGLTNLNEKLVINLLN